MFIMVLIDRSPTGARGMETNYVVVAGKGCAINMFHNNDPGGRGHCEGWCVCCTGSSFSPLACTNLCNKTSAYFAQEAGHWRGVVSEEVGETRR